jgi:chromosome segregation ATPase
MTVFVPPLTKECKEKGLPVSLISFDYTNSSRKISYLDVLNCKKGWISIDKLINDSFEKEEHLIITATCDNGEIIEEDIVDKIMELPADTKRIDEDIPIEIINLRKEMEKKRILDIENKNKKYFLNECEKLDEWSEDKKNSLTEDIDQLDKLIKEKKKEMSLDLDATLEEIINIKEEINKLKKQRDKKHRELFEAQKQIEDENERLQEAMRMKIRGNSTTENIFTVRFEIV